MAISTLLMLSLIGFCFTLHSGISVKSIEGSRSPSTTWVMPDNAGGNETKGAVKFDLFPKPVVPGLTDAHPTAHNNDRVLHVALCQSSFSEYYGAAATFSVHALQVLQRDQFSSSQIWINNGDPNVPEEVNVLQAGWQVYPELYGDNEVHFYTYWTADNYGKTGCYNLDCSGFVLREGSPIVPGGALFSDPTYITLSITKGSPDDDWLLLYQDDSYATVVGHWPRSLFTRLAQNANAISFGGAVSFATGASGPPMGSGYFSNEGEDKAAYFKNLHYMDPDGNLQDFKPAGQTIKVDAKDCYDLRLLSNSGDGGNGLRFFYGGPSGCTNYI